MVGLVFFLMGLFSSSVLAVDVVSGSYKPICKEISLNSDLPIYKDPSLFLPSLGLIANDPEHGVDSLLEESPLLTTVNSSSVRLMVLGDPTPFKNFGYVSVIYGMAEPKLEVPAGKRRRKEWLKKPPMILPVKLCGEDSYKDTLGFVLLSDLDLAQNAFTKSKSLPPSIAPNPIPRLRK